MTYVLITAARNEERYLELTILSVINQTLLPKRWIIVSDGSTDRTDEIILAYKNRYEWIHSLRMPEHRDRSFAAKVGCISSAYETVRGLDFDLIGNLDADISFDEDYLKFLVEKFEKTPELGVAGTPFYEQGSGSSKHGLSNIEHVSGACQLFRRTCFDEIGGYKPVGRGGIDWVAVTTARMRGWKTRTYLDKECQHHRKIGTAKENNVLIARFNYGQKDYFLGGHPLWEVFRAVLQMAKKPIIIGGAMILSGYIFEALRRADRPIPRELMDFHRKEQLARLRRTFAALLMRDHSGYVE